MITSAEKDAIRAFVVQNFYVPDPTMLGDDTSLLERGIVDSTGVLEVTAFLEETFGIRIDDTEILPENLDTIGAMAAFVARKRTNPGAVREAS